MNNITLIGRLVRDLEVKEVNGNIITEGTLAVNKALSKDKKEEMEKLGKPTANFFNFSLFGKSGLILQEFTGKGKQLAINGELDIQTYTNKENNIVYKNNVLVRNFDILEFK